MAVILSRPQCVNTFLEHIHTNLTHPVLKWVQMLVKCSRSIAQNVIKCISLTKFVEYTPRSTVYMIYMQMPFYTWIKRFQNVVIKGVHRLFLVCVLAHPCTTWRHQMETFSALLALCARNSSVTGEFPSQRPVTQSFDVFFDLRLNKRLSKQSRRRWFETPSRSFWRHFALCCGLVLFSRVASRALRQ